MIKSRAKPLGLNAGWGCGVALGYGWGAGVMLKPTALESLGQAIKSKIPPSILQKITPMHQQNKGITNPEIIRNDGLNVPGLQDASIMRADVGIDGSGAPTKQASLNINSPTLPASSPTVSTTASLEKDVAELTKIVLRQQVTLENIQRQLEILQSEVSQRSQDSVKKR